MLPPDARPGGREKEASHGHSSAPRITRSTQQAAIVSVIATAAARGDAAAYLAAHEPGEPIELLLFPLAIGDRVNHP
jgi:hypothetical protein